jgi:hypothetical protein
MLKLCSLLAAEIDPLELARGSQPSRIFGMAMKDFVLLTGVIAALAILLFAYVWFTRRDPRRRAASSGTRVLYRSEKRAQGKVRIRRRRSRHPENLPRNATLAEAGGLPPIREERAKPAC